MYDSLTYVVLGILNLFLIVSADSFMPCFFLCFVFFDCDLIARSQSVVSLGPKFRKIFSRKNLFVHLQVTRGCC